MAWKNKAGMPTVTRTTHTIDAAGKSVGRLATQIARLLIGKHKASYEPNLDEGDSVKVINVSQIALTGKKWEQKEIFRSSNRPSGVKSTPMSRMRKENCDDILMHAIKYMLPKNKLQTDRLKRVTFLK